MGPVNGYIFKGQTARTNTQIPAKCDIFLHKRKYPQTDRIEIHPHHDEHFGQQETIVFDMPSGANATLIKNKDRLVIYDEKYNEKAWAWFLGKPSQYAAMYKMFPWLERNQQKRMTWQLNEARRKHEKQRRSKSVPPTSSRTKKVERPFERMRPTPRKVDTVREKKKPTSRSLPVNRSPRSRRVKNKSRRSHRSSSAAPRSARSKSRIRSTAPSKPSAIPERTLRRRKGTQLIDLDASQQAFLAGKRSPTETVTDAEGSTEPRTRGLFF